VPPPVVPLEPDSFSESRVLRENNRDDPENLLRKPKKFNRSRGLSKRLFFDLCANRESHVLRPWEVRKNRER
jgi:hypothetical protein